MTTIEQVRNELSNRTDRSAWAKGVTAYALELLDKLEEYREYKGNNTLIDRSKLKAELLNGADDWNQYSWGGGSLIYNYEIAERLCTPSELKRTKGGELRPNHREEWLDTQARALTQAYMLISDICFKNEFAEVAQ